MPDCIRACPWWDNRWYPGGSPPRIGPGHLWAPGHSEVQRCSVGFRWASQWYQVLHPPGTSCTLTTWGRVLLCTRNVWHWSKDVVLILMVVSLPSKGLCIPPWICLPRSLWTHQETSHAEPYYREHNVLHGFSRTFHFWHVFICEKHWAPVVDLQILIFYVKCQLDSIMPSSKHRAR